MSFNKNEYMKLYYQKNKDKIKRRIKENSKCGVYCIQNKITGKMYIGSSRNIQDRLNKHFTALRNHLPESPNLQKDWDLYSEDNFEGFILILCEPENLLKWEQFYLNTNTGQYNTFKQADGSIMPDVVKEKISKSMKGKQNRIKKDAKNING